MEEVEDAWEALRGTRSCVGGRPVDESSSSLCQLYTNLAVVSYAVCRALARLLRSCQQQLGYIHVRAISQVMRPAR